MHPGMKRLRALWPLLVDLPLTLAALYLADGLRHRLRLGLPITPETVYLTPEIYAVVLLIWAFIYPSLLQRPGDRSRELGAVLFAASLSTLTFASLLYLLKYPDFSRMLFLYFYALDLCFIGSARLLAQLFWRWLHARGHGLVRVLVVGANDWGRELARRLPKDWPGCQVVGLLDNEGAAPTLGALAEVAEVVRRHRIDEVIVALPPARRNEAVQCILDLQALPVRIKIVPDFLELATIRATVEKLRDIPLIGLRDPVLSDFDAAVKRLFDLLVSSLAIAFTWPLMLAIALWIKLDSPGPVLFVQERIGENGRPFKMYKFRSMVADAEERLGEVVDLEELAEPAFKVRADPRTTRAGRFLRRISLDELPQLFNVWRGEMSLVGPRPEEARMVARYDSWQRKRLALKPGMTGPMQVNGRGDLPLEERLRLELLYIEEYSLWRDIAILLKTVPAVILGRGSY